jgi:hypothetical protein
LFGPLATLQNVATISCRQMTPVLVSGELFVWPPAPSGCCTCDCAATGEAAKSSATVKANIFIACSIRYLTPQRGPMAQ